MKKVAAGFLAGAMLMIGTQAMGASNSMVGRKVQAEYTVNVYGKKLVDSAIIIDGKSYAPVRAIGELAGYKVTVSGKNISLDEKDNGKSFAGQKKITVPPSQQSFTVTDPALAAAKNKVNMIDDKIDEVVDRILLTSSQLKSEPNNYDLKQKLEQYKADYADLLKLKDLELQK